MGVQNTDASGAPPAPTRHEQLAARLYDAPAPNTSEEFYPLENAIKTGSPDIKVGPSPGRSDQSYAIWGVNA